MVVGNLVEDSEARDQRFSAYIRKVQELRDNYRRELNSLLKGREEMSNMAREHSASREEAMKKHGLTPEGSSSTKGTRPPNVIMAIKNDDLISCKKADHSVTLN